MRGFFRDFIIYGFASVVGKIAAVFLLPIYTSVLTQEEYGIMAMLVSIKGIIDLVSNLNIHSGIARDYYSSNVNRRKLVSTGFWSILLISVSILLILYFSRFFWIEKVLDIPNYENCFILLLLTIPAGSFVTYFSVLTRYKKKPILFSVGTLIALFLQITIAILIIVKFRMGIIGFFMGTLTSELFSIIYYGAINRENISLQFSFDYLKRALKFCVPLLPAILAGWIDSSMGQIIMGRFISYEDLGVYSIALQISSVFTLVSIALQNVWHPFLYEKYNDPGFKEEINKLFFLFMMGLILISSSVSLLSKEIILILSNPNYIDASKYLTILCVPMSLYVMFPFVSSGISICRDTKYTSIAYIFGSFLNIIFLLATIKFIGVLAVPIGLAFSRVCAFLYLHTISKKKVDFSLPYYYAWFLIGVIVLCYICVSTSLSIIVRGFILIVIWGLTLWIINKRFHWLPYRKSNLLRSE